MLDELVADWLGETGALPSKATVLELMQWSAQQAKMAKAVGQEQPVSRGISPAKVERPAKVKVLCPACQASMDTVPAKTLICPTCRTLFAMETGAVLGKVPL